MSHVRRLERRRTIRRLRIEEFESRRLLTSDLQILKDINTSNETSGSGPRNMVQVGDFAYFAAFDPQHGTELWRTDGTAAGTSLVKDIREGVRGSSPANLANINGQLFFSADDGLSGIELWKSDGTAEGTVLVKDIYVGTDLNSRPVDLTNVNGVAYFRATSQDATFSQGLWKSDGTTAGTVLVREFQNVGGGLVGISELVNFDGKLFFPANDGINGKELWVADDAGARMVRDINAGSLWADPEELTVVNGVMYFAALSDDSGRELWRTDGTSGGTVLVQDISEGRNGSSPKDLTNLNGTLMFSAFEPIFGRELWRSAGTAASTTIVQDITFGTASSNPRRLINFNGTLVFMASSPNAGYELYRSNGLGAELALDIRPGVSSSDINLLTVVNDTLYFVANDGTNGLELWKTGGGDSQTRLVRDIFTGPNSSSPANLAIFKDTLLFSANDGSNGTELWISNPLTSSATLLTNIIKGQSSYPTDWTEVNGIVYFSAADGTNGKELWRSDGTEVGTYLVANIAPGSRSSYPQQMANVNGVLFFTASDGFVSELWKSDGTNAGTVRVADLRPGSFSSFPRNLTNVNGVLYFDADDGTHGREIWKSDGTTQGTVLVQDIFPGAKGSSPANLINVGGTFFFTASDSVGNVELWSIGPNQAPVVREILPGAGGSNPSGLIAANDYLYFAANDGVHGTELWRANAAGATVQLVRDIAAGSESSSPSDLAYLNGTVYFAATSTATGTELWRTDGTEIGTVLVADLIEGPGGSNPRQLTAVNNSVYFSAISPSTGRELWVSQGTRPTTRLVADIFAGPDSSSPHELTNANGQLYFTASTADGRELWQSRGSAGTTSMVADLSSLPGGSRPRDLTTTTAKLFMLANSDFYGNEPFVLTLDPLNTAPTMDTSLTQAFVAINEDNANPFGKSILSLTSGVIDSDIAPKRGIAVTSIAGNSNGQWQYTLDNGARWNPISSVSTTEALLLPSNGNLVRIRFVPNPNFNGTVSMQYRAWDQSQGETGTLMDTTFSGGSSPFSVAVESAIQDIDAVNDAPTLNTAPEVNLNSTNEDATTPTATSVATLLSGFADIDENASRGIALVSVTGATTGTWQYSLNQGISWSDVGAVSRTASLLLPELALLRYRPNVNFNGQVNITFKAWDQTSGLVATKADTSSSGGRSAFSAASEIGTLPVRPINDAPVLNPSVNQDFGPISEDNFNSSGRWVASLSSGISDVDAGALRGIAITSLSGVTAGRWEFTLNGGTTWQPIPAISRPNALLLPSNGSQSRVRFVPNSNFNGEVKIIYRAWDQTSGVAGTVAAIVAVGRNTAFSVLTETANQLVRAVNDAPVLTSTSSIALGSISQSDTNNAGLATGVLTSGVTDIDAFSVRGIVLLEASSTASGQWQYSLNSGVSWIPITTVSTTSALLLPEASRLRFVPSVGLAGRAQLVFRAWDQTSGTNGSRVDLSLASSVGGTTAFSRLSRTAWLGVS